MANEQTNQWNRVKSPKVSPSIYRNLVYDEVNISSH